MGCLQYHKVSFNPQKLRINGLPIINIGRNAMVKIGDDVAIASGSDNGTLIPQHFDLTLFISS